MANQIGALLLVVLIGAGVDSKSYQNYKVYSVHARDERDLNFLKYLESNHNNLDFWDRVHHVANTSYRVMVPPSIDQTFAKLLSDHKIESQVIIDDVGKVVNVKQVRGRSSNIDFTHFWTYDEVNSYLDSLAKDYANYTKVSVIGMSGENREIRSIHIEGENVDGKPNQYLLIDATIHAREWIAPMMAVYLIHELVENRDKNINLLTNFNWVIVPIVNPDGYVYTHEHDRFWRKTRSVNPKSSCVGVDANRNFDFHWNTRGASSKNPCREDYRGPKPSAIPEVVTLSNFLKQYPNAMLYLTLHSYGGYILYPYGYDVVPVKNYIRIERLANLVQQQIYKQNGFKYQVGNSAKLLYPASGGSDDYAAAIGKIPYVYTFELPGGGPAGFDIPATEITPVVKETFIGFKVFTKFFGNKKNNRKLLC